MILAIRFLLVFSTIIFLVGARNCKDVFRNSITKVKIRSNCKVGDLVHTVVLKDENVPIEDIHLVQRNGFFQLNPSNKSQLIVKFCLPAGYTELLRLSVGSCKSYVRIQVSSIAPAHSRRVTAYVSNTTEIVNVLDTNRHDINICIPKTCKCMVKCTNKDHAFWVDSDMVTFTYWKMFFNSPIDRQGMWLKDFNHIVLACIIKTHTYDRILGTDFVLDGICLRSMRALIPMTYFRITVTFKLRRAKKQTSDIWRNLRYSNQLTDTRTKHSYFVTMSPSNQNNQLMTSNNKTYNTKETSNRQIRGDAYLEKIPSNSGFVRKKRCVQDICPGTPKGLTYFGGLSRTQTKSIVHIISNQPLTTTTPLASSTEDVSVTITVGSSMEQALETNSVINVETNEPTTELNLTSSTTNSALMNSFPPISTGKTVITEAETASATSSGVVDKDISGIYSSFTTSKPLTQPKSLSALTPPSSSTTNEQINVRSTSSTVTTTHVQTGTAILRNEERARADNETDEIPSILSSPMQTAHTMPDSGAVATTILDAVGVLLMALLTVSIS